tara:strand:- start:375 stop:866 length:492 start_codon:yes stop_codon:yes gene_type:complete
MIIKVKNKNTLILDDFKFKCCVGKNGISNQKKEGDKKTPRGTFQLGDLYFRKDRISKLETNLKTVPISKNMGWCDDIKSIKYNKIIRATKKLKYEKMYRKDANYDFLIPIKYNYKKPISGRGSAIFLHLTKDYKKTLGCVAIKKRDMMILIRLINKKTKIKID